LSFFRLEGSVVVHPQFFVNEFVEHAIAALRKGVETPEIKNRSSLAGVIEFRLSKALGGYSGVFVGSEQARRVSCVVKFPDTIEDGVRPELMLLCFLINASLDLGSLEFTHSGNELIAKVTQVLLPGHSCNAAIVEECVTTAIKLMQQYAESIRSVIKGDMKAANAFHTHQFLAQSDAVKPLDVSDFEKE